MPLAQPPLLSLAAATSLPAAIRLQTAAAGNELSTSLCTLGQLMDATQQPPVGHVFLATFLQANELSISLLAAVPAFLIAGTSLFYLGRWAAAAAILAPSMTFPLPGKPRCLCTLSCHRLERRRLGLLQANAGAHRHACNPAGSLPPPIHTHAL